MKGHLLLILVLVLQSCGWSNNKKQGARQEADSLNLTTLTESNSLQSHNFDDATAEQMLIEFYTACLTEMMKDDVSPQCQSRLEQIQKRHVHTELLDRISGDSELGHNPFIDAQDYDDNWIKTLKVTKRESGVFVVSFINGFDNQLKEIVLEVENRNNEYKISNILPVNAIRQSANKDSEETDELCGSNGTVNRGKYTYDNGNIIIEIRRDNHYRIIERGELLDMGIYSTSSENDVLYIKMKDIGALYNTDTLSIQNYGNSMNPYHHFESVDEKYIDLIRDSGK